MLHIEHPEDSILTGNLNVLDWFRTPGDLSVKMDGSPLIVWGTNPENQRFFIGTKAVFNKKKKRIAHDHDEIDSLYSGEVAKILHSCFNWLPRTTSIYGADFLGWGKAKEVQSNVIQYVFPEVVSQEIVLAPHTSFSCENSLQNFTSNVNSSSWDNTEFIRFVKPKSWILNQNNEERMFFDDSQQVCNFAQQMSSMVKFATDQESTEIRKKINYCIKNGLKIEEENFDCDSNLIGLWKLIKSIKEDCLFLCRNNGPDAYIHENKVDAEGYCFSNSYGMYKLINREVYSRENFMSGQFSH
jgi:hypothetical protein